MVGDNRRWKTYEPVTGWSRCRLCGVYVTTAHWTSDRHCKALRTFTGPLPEPEPLPSLPAHWAKPPGSPHQFEYREDFQGSDQWWCLLCNQSCSDEHVGSKQHIRKLQWETNLVPAEQREIQNDSITCDSSHVVSREQRLADAQHSEWAAQRAPPPPPRPPKRNPPGAAGAAAPPFQAEAEAEAPCDAENAQHLFALEWQPTGSMQWLDNGAAEKACNDV